jgi:hypothetical protein
VGLLHHADHVPESGLFIAFFFARGMAFGSALTGWHIEKFQKIPGAKVIDLPWYVLLALLCCC